MKIALDTSPLESGHKVRGVGFYVKHLQNALQTYIPENSYQFFSKPQEVTKADVIHYPYFELFFPALPFSNNFPTVITIHDLTPLLLPKQFVVGIKGKVFTYYNKLVAKRADAIITDSLSSKKDIIKLLDINENKVHVVYLAAGDKFALKKLSDTRKNELKTRYHLPDQFVLYVGDVTANKNLPRLLKAAQSLDEHVVLVGKSIASRDFDHSHPWNKDLVDVQRLADNNEKIHILGFVPTDDLIDVYNLATVFALVSLYEGFGLPILEAMQSGCPVVTTQEGSLPEVAGQAALYVDAQSEESIASGLKKVIESKKLQRELREKGLQQAKKFSWKRTAQETLAVYKSIV